MIIVGDGFDHYGGRLAMLDGAWAEVDSNLNVQTAQKRTGTHSLGKNSGSSAEIARRVLPGSTYDNVGFGAAMFWTNLPTTNNRSLVCQWRDGSNSAVCTVTLQSTGDMAVKKGDQNGTVVGTTSGGPIVASAFQHIEAFFTFAGTSGAVEIRVNGVTVLDLTNVDIGAASSVRQFVWGCTAGSGSGAYFIDDLYIYDDQGTDNNAIGIGDLKLQLIKPNADTAQADWTRNTGSADYDAIDDTAPDDDTTYLSASTSNDLSEFDLEDTDPLAESIKFIATYTSARKTDAGSASIKVGLASSNIGSPPTPAQSLGDEHTLSEVYTYYMDIFETDPATGSAFTPSAVDDARLLLQRV